MPVLVGLNGTGRVIKNRMNHILRIHVSAVTGVNGCGMLGLPGLRILGSATTIEWMSNPSMITVGGIVLCGGMSTRMGRPKLSLPFGSETMLERVVGVLESVVSPIVVVAAPGQKLPSLPRHVIVARDERENLGPLGGLAPGLSVLRPKVEAAFASSCDVPFLKPEFVRRMIDDLGDHDLAIPHDEDYYHPLAAVYRTRLEDAVRALIAEDRLRPFFLIEQCDSVIVDVDVLRAVDPRLCSLRNINTQEEYQSALQDAGLA